MLPQASWTRADDAHPGAILYDSARRRLVTAANRPYVWHHKVCVRIALAACWCKKSANPWLDGGDRQSQPCTECFEQSQWHERCMSMHASAA